MQLPDLTTLVKNVLLAAVEELEAKNEPSTAGVQQNLTYL